MSAQTPAQLPWPGQTPFVPAFAPMPEAAVLSVKAGETKACRAVPSDDSLEGGPDVQPLPATPSPSASTNAHPLVALRTRRLSHLIDFPPRSKLGFPTM